MSIPTLHKKANLVDGSGNTFSPVTNAKTVYLDSGESIDHAIESDRQKIEDLKKLFGYTFVVDSQETFDEWTHNQIAENDYSNILIVGGNYNTYEPIDMDKLGTDTITGCKGYYENSKKPKYPLILFHNCKHGITSSEKTHELIENKIENIRISMEYDNYNNGNIVSAFYSIRSIVNCHITVNNYKNEIPFTVIAIRHCCFVSQTTCILHDHNPDIQPQNIFYMTDNKDHGPNILPLSQMDDGITLAQIVK